MWQKLQKVLGVWKDALQEYLPSDYPKPTVRQAPGIARNSRISGVGIATHQLGALRRERLGQHPAAASGYAGAQDDLVHEHAHRATSSFLRAGYGPSPFGTTRECGYESVSSPPRYSAPASGADAAIPGALGMKLK
jgi:hypothetical protein